MLKKQKNAVDVPKNDAEGALGVADLKSLQKGYMGELGVTECAVIMLKLEEKWH